MSTNETRDPATTHPQGPGPIRPQLGRLPAQVPALKERIENFVRFSASMGFSYENQTRSLRREAAGIYAVIRGSHSEPVALTIAKALRRKGPGVKRSAVRRPKHRS